MKTMKYAMMKKEIIMQHRRLCDLQHASTWLIYFATISELDRLLYVLMLSLSLPTHLFLMSTLIIMIMMLILLQISRLQRQFR